MKKPLRVLSISLLVIISGLYLYTNKQQAHYNLSAPTYIADILTDLSYSDWQSESLDQYLSTAAKAAVSSQQLQQVLSRYRSLGLLKDIEYVKFSRLASALSIFGDTYVSYTGVVAFRNGNADLNITFIEENDQLLITNISLTPTKPN